MATPFGQRLWPSSVRSALAALQIPEPQRLVPGRRDGPAPVGRDGDLSHRTAVAFERADVWPLSRSQTRSVLSEDAETARRPSGVMATPFTEPLWPSSVRRLWPLSRSQTRSVLSSDAETARRLSGVMATPLTELAVAFERTDALAALQIPNSQRVVQDAETARRPSGVMATPCTERLWPSSVRSFGRSPDPKPAASCPRMPRPHGVRPV